ncbi:MAG: glycosyl hydrolase 108 family protein [Methylovulum sp.]|nr:glycosyl hydrolase 108 family protein [Methylovulum sp.]
MAAGNFQNCLPVTLREEGGYSNVAADSGGATQWGVTHATYDAYRDGKGLPRQDVRLITTAERDDIYLGGYWNAIGASGLPAGVDLSGFDYAVNSGPKKARFELAKVMKTDAFGAVTNQAPAAIIDQIANDRLSFLHGLGNWGAFGKGWGARVARIEAASLKMAGAPIPAAASAARAKAGAAKNKAIGAGAGSGIVASAASGLSPVIAHGGWILLTMVGVALAVVGIHAFAAWRQGQRAITLDQAVADLQAREKAALAAQAASVAAKTTATAAVAAEQQKIDAAKAAIASAAPEARAVIFPQTGTPPQVH